MFRHQFNDIRSGRRYGLLFLLLSSLALATGCRQAAAEHASPITASPCVIALAPHAGEAKLDAEIRQIQQKVHRNEARALNPADLVEQLGWRFVEKARQSYDPGFYKLAEQCAACLGQFNKVKKPTETEQGPTPQFSGDPQAMLLRGHVLQNLHKFKEAEPLARELSEKRGLAFDHGLLGDVLMEQGRLNEAADAYQKMMDARPGLQAYSRAAQLRWLKGDLQGALEIMLKAVQATSPSEPEASAWIYTRFALLQLQAGARGVALTACEAALKLQPNYAPALLAKGRVLLAENKTGEALLNLQQAAQLNPLPEYQWTLADALRAASREAEARAVETQLHAKGASEDPRTYALYLATRGEQAETAVRLAEAERKERNDIFTLDAQAWALSAAGRHEEAYALLPQALSEKTKDARLFLHAAVIAQRSGRATEAQVHAKQAAAIAQMLLPGERAQLQQLKFPPTGQQL